MFRKALLSTLLGASLVTTSLAVFGCDQKLKQETPATYKVETFVPGAPFHGLHGMTFGPDNVLYVGSVVGQAIYTVDTETGAVAEFIGPVEGQADDLEFNASGGLAWTAIGQGKVYYQTASGDRRVVAEGLPGANSLAFNDEGRLFMTTVFMADALYEVHLSGKTPPRQIMEGMGGLNGFDFGPDGKLYGPIWFKGQIARVDVDAGTLEVISEGMTVPAAVNFDSKGVLHAIDNETGEIFQVDVESGERRLIATAPSNLDNLAFDRDDRLYISNMSDTAIYEVNRETGALRTVVEGPLSVPAGLDAHGDTLYVADTFNFTKVDLATGEVGDISRLISDHEYPTDVDAGDERILIASANAGMIQIYDPVTELRTGRWEGFLIPVGVVDLGDKVAVLEGIGRITMVTGDDGQTRETLIEGLTDSGALAYHDGAFYVSEGALGLVSKVDAETGEKTPLAEGLLQPEGIVVDDSGTVFVAEVGAGQVREIKAGGETRVIAEGLKMGLKGYPPFPPTYIPTGIALAEDGSLYVSSDVENSIYKLVRE